MVKANIRLYNQTGRPMEIILRKGESLETAKKNLSARQAKKQISVRRGIQTEIRNSHEHSAALAEIEELMNNVKSGTRVNDRLELLIELVEKYEGKHFLI